MRIDGRNFPTDLGAEMARELRLRAVTQLLASGVKILGLLNLGDQVCQRHGTLHHLRHHLLVVNRPGLRQMRIDRALQRRQLLL
ncbi:hypothetical protein D3C75_1206490 [compost metagenome]